MKIRPCIDIHGGKVKQIVGSSLKDPLISYDNKSVDAVSDGSDALNDALSDALTDTPGRMGEVIENFVSGYDADHFAGIYRDMDLPGGHVILLDPVSDRETYQKDLEQAKLALGAFPGGMQIGGGITADNAEQMLDLGASHIIVTSYVFHDGIVDRERLRRLQDAAGKERITLDLSCRKKSDGCYYVVSNRWQVFTDVQVNADSLDALSGECAEFLIHAADVEGKRGGIDKDLAGILGRFAKNSGFLVVYAGGVRSLDDLGLLAEYSDGALDVTVGSALDLFGGSLSLEELKEEARRLTDR